MSKKSTTALAISLSSTQVQIEETQLKISEIKSKISEQNKSINEFEEALNLIENDSKYLPAPNELVPYDQLKKLLAEEVTEQDKQSRLTTANRALQDCKNALQATVTELDDFNNQLAYLQSEDEWERVYLPHEEQYRDSFPMRTAQQNRELEIVSLKNDLAYKKEILEAAEQYLDAPINAKPRYQYPGPFDKPTEMVVKMPKTIVELEEKLKGLEELPVTESLEFMQKFRQYVRARVLVEKPLATLLKAQASYLSAIKEFQTTYAQLQPEILNLNVQTLDRNLKPWSLDENNAIRQSQTSYI